MEFIHDYKDFPLLVDVEKGRDLNISYTERRFIEEG